jgi:2-polyprenyl-3-methyl-5-hydroxy-6-metoxy-1,4-benzoquinol methylase
MKKCYLCESNAFLERDGEVRDAPNLKILECKDCRLVSLNSFEHIQSGHYENSRMHGEEIQTMESWLQNTEWDDQRRFEMLKSILPNKKILDFGCGNGGFILRGKELAAEIVGLEVEKRVQDYWSGRMNVVPDLESAGGGYDLITAFHVVEHLPDPRKVLREMSEHLSDNGMIVVEVPSSEDALLTMYECVAFQRFTYWSQHLFLFNTNTLQTVVNQSGLKLITIQQFQRYPLSNHLFWLSQGKPGGHKQWSFLDTPQLKAAYANSLGAIGKCDTLIAHIEGLKPLTKR